MTMAESPVNEYSRRELNALRKSWQEEHDKRIRLEERLRYTNLQIEDCLGQIRQLRSLQLSHDAFDRLAGAVQYQILCDTDLSNWDHAALAEILECLASAICLLDVEEE